MVRATMLLASLLLPWCSFESRASVTEIIDSTGDGLGNGLDSPSDVAIDPNGNVLVTGEGSDNAFRITPMGTIQEVIDSTGDGTGNGLSEPSAVAVDGSGNAFVAGRASSNVFKITPSGTVVEIIDSTGDGVGHPLVSPEDVGVDANGNVYVPSNGFGTDSLFKITPAGTITRHGGDLESPVAIAVESDGSVDVGTSTEVLRIAPNGTPTQLIGIEGADGHPLGAALGLALDPAENLYVVGADRHPTPYPNGFNAVFKVATDGQVTLVADIHDLPTYPIAAAADSSGNVYVSSQDTTFGISPFGDVSVIADVGEPSAEVFGRAGGVVSDSSGNVYVASRLTDNVVKISVGLPVCNDGLDNDSDGLTDFPDDPGCLIAASQIEDPACNDGLDNDSDTKVDFPDDRGCAAAYADIEDPECNDGVDNDSDSLTDFGADPHCQSASNDSELELARNWIGTLELKVGSLPPVVSTSQGVAYFAGPPASPNQMRLAGRIGAVGHLSGTTLLGVTGVQPARAILSARVKSGTVALPTGTAPAVDAAVPLSGALRFCIVTSCYFDSGLNLTTNTGMTGVGIGGTTLIGEGTAPGNVVRISVAGAPWTFGSATLPTGTPSGPTVMSAGFIHSQASSTVVTPFATLKMVSPVRITTGGTLGGGTTAMFTSLTLRLIPEPTAPLLLFSGAIVLLLLGRSRQRH